MTCHPERARQARAKDLLLKGNDQIMRTKAFLTAFIILASSAAAQSTRDSLLALDSAWARSYATADTALANRLFDDSLIVTSGNGRLKDKKSEMSDVGPLRLGFQIHYFR